MQILTKKIHLTNLWDTKLDVSDLVDLDVNSAENSVLLTWVPRLADTITVINRVETP